MEADGSNQNLQLLKIEFDESPLLSSSDECRNYFEENKRQINGKLPLL